VRAFSILLLLMNMFFILMQEHFLQFDYFYIWTIEFNLQYHMPFLGCLDKSCLADLLVLVHCNDLSLQICNFSVFDKSEVKLMWIKR
jgi:hypothetical protein